MESRTNKILSCISEMRSRLSVLKCKAASGSTLLVCISRLSGSMKLTLRLRYTTLDIFASTSMYAFNDYNVLFRATTCV